MEETDQVSIDVVELTSLFSSSGCSEEEIYERCCIYRVPAPLSRRNEDAYTPQAISIGPFHHGRKELEAMDEHKQRFLEDFVLKSKKAKGELLQSVEDNEERLRNCYSEVIHLGREKFANMILLDATFIIEFFYKCFFEPECHDRLLSQPYICSLARHDLLVLENQIPFFILQVLLDLSGIATPSLPSDVITLGEAFADEAHRFLCTNQKLSFLKITYLSFQLHPELRVREFSPKELDSLVSSVHHLLGFLRTCLLPHAIPPRDMMTNKSDDLRSMPTATELHQAGVEFHKLESQSFLDIQFDRTTGVLKIPFLFLGCYAESLFRNLVAFEQFHCLDKPMLTDYLILLDLLIDTPRDVDILAENKILENTLGDSNAASAMFNNMAQNLFFLHFFYFSDVCNGLNAYYRRPSHKYKATLKQNYFKSPWAAISVIAAAVLLILTIVQTVFSIVK